jgi:hypothetical protein
LATEFAPMVPPAPLRTSTSTGWLHAASSFCAINRPTKSTGEPAENGLTILIGRFG